MDKIAKEILQEIKPNLEEKARFKRVTGSFLRQLNSHLKGAKAILGGSGAKDTWLAGNHDVDIFVQFAYKPFQEKSAELSFDLFPALKKSFPREKIRKVHGSRDYFLLEHQGYSFEVVPILKISKAGKAKNITDISPLHAAWLNKKAKKLKDEIRLAKQFAKAHQLYGAESYISGFSGYVLEILVVYYGSFGELLKASQKWRKEVIDVENHYPRKDALFHLNRSKLVSPLIVVDPVDKERNAAAALSLEKLNLFKRKAKEFLAKPEKSAFWKKQINLGELQKLAGKKNLLYLEIEPLSGKEDVVGSKLLKAFKFLERRLSPFSVSKSGWEFGKKTFFYFILDRKELPQEEIKGGPPLFIEEAVNNFKKVYPKTYTDNVRIFAKVKIKKRTLGGYLENVLKEKDFCERVKKVSHEKSAENVSLCHIRRSYGFRDPQNAQHFSGNGEACTETHSLN